MFDADNAVVLKAEEAIDKEGQADNATDGEEIITTGSESVEETSGAESGAEELSGTTQSVPILDDVDVPAALALSGLGFGIVFSVLVVLMAFITVMSAVIRGGKKEEKPAQKQQKKAESTPVPAPVKEAAPAPAVKGDADMYVSLNGKKHAVSVEEKLPRFTVTLNGKTHGVDVESAEEE